MRQTSLKHIRVVTSLVIFLFITFIFIDFTELVPARITSGILYFQFIPSLMKFITLLSFSAAGFIIILLITALSGRIYCSLICPLGILQDIIACIKRKINLTRKYRFIKPVNVLRYGFLICTILVLITGSVSLVSLLDPYSNYGRISSGLLRPVYTGLNNLATTILGKLNIYLLQPETIFPARWQVYVYPCIILGVILWLSISYGRMYCNTVCPVGTLLGLLSRISLFRIRINKGLCTKCGDCVISCKASCISINKQQIDFSRCVACFNCIKACPEHATGYSRALSASGISPRSSGRQRRQFLWLFGAGLAGMAGFSRQAWAQEISVKNKKPTVIRERKTCPVTPPCSLGYHHYTTTCTACHLCVTVCPTHVLQPSLFEYGLPGIMQPYMDYHTNYCHYECKLCSEICPSGAILSLSKEKKESTQLGQVHLILENCVVYTENTACGSCSEHCPTQAVRMVPYINDLTIPEIRPEICVGCGACEYACPTRPYRAIYVDGHYQHKAAEKPKTEKLEDKKTDEFPF